MSYDPTFLHVLCTGSLASALLLIGITCIMRGEPIVPAEADEMEAFRYFVLGIIYSIVGAIVAGYAVAAGMWLWR